MYSTPLFGLVLIFYYLLGENACINQCFPKNMALLNQEEQKKYGSVLDDQEDSSGSGDKSVQNTDITCTSIDASQVLQKIG